MTGTGLNITTEDTGNGHVSIDVASPVVDVDEHARARHSKAQLYKGRHSAAGTLARLGLHLAADMHVQRVAHRCTPHDARDGCHVGCTQQVLTPGEDCDESVAVWFNVPPEAVDTWLSKVTEGLQQIISDTPWTDTEDET